MKDALILILVWLTTSSAFILSRIENLKQRLPSSLRANSFTRSNPMSDKISAKEFHHIEFYCGDATTTYKRFQIGLGMHLVANSDQSTSNIEHCSYVLKSNNMTMVFTAPYSSEEGKKSCSPFPGFSRETCSNFFSAHGLGVRAVAITVDDVGSSFQAAIANGGREHIAPQKLIDNFGLGWVDYAEVFLYGDVVLRLINLDNYRGHFFPNFQDIKQTKPFQPPFSHLLSNPVYEPKRDDSTFGFSRFDHIVGNLWSLEPTLTTLKAMTVSPSKSESESQSPIWLIFHNLIHTFPSSLPLFTSLSLLLPPHRVPRLLVIVIPSHTQGFHEFAEFVAGDVGTVDSGLNSVVLANNNEMVLLPLNEPTFGTKRKSQIQTYLEQNNVSAACQSGKN